MFRGVLFCFESVRPDGVIELSNTRHLPFIAHPISHAWFHTPRVLWHQLDIMLKIQARQSGLPIVSAGNMTEGKLYLPDGTVHQGEVIGEGKYYTLRLYRF